MGSGSSKPVQPNAVGKHFIITGANSGIGFCCARDLYRSGGNVTLCARSKDKAEKAIQDIKKEVGELSPEFQSTANLSVGIVDLSSLGSVKAFADSIVQKQQTVDCLINNAGVYMLPKLEKSTDGFEMQLATNCLGHYALTLQLLPVLRKSTKPRVVNVSSIKARNFVPPADVSIPVDLKKDGEGVYNDERVYDESKLCNLMFNNELARRCPDITAVGAHPGVCASNLFRHKHGWLTFMMQTPDKGALSVMKAAVEPEVESGKTYYGPGGSGWYGGPESITMPPAAFDAAQNKRYWDAMEVATGISAS